MFKKVCNSKELNDLISSLRSRFPDTQHVRPKRYLCTPIVALHNIFA